MATYNGSEYLVSQLDSIAAQTLLPEEIIICDDCSSDETINIIERHQLFKIIKLNVNEHRIGIVENFKKATALCKFDNFIAFADQDDIWLPTKLEKNHNALGALNCQNLPALVYSDAIFVNKNGDILNYSFMKEMGIDKFKHNFETVLFGSLMLGCTIMFNSKMREVLLTLPSNANFNHDAWVSLASFSFGVNYFIKEPLILYRKHEKNSTISAYKKINRFNKIKKISPAVALGGGKDEKIGKGPKEKVSKYEEDLARATFNFYKDNLFQAETFFNQLNDIEKFNALKEAVINKASNEELSAIEATYAQKSINFHQQIEDKKLAIRQASLKRGEDLTEADLKAKKKILDRDFQNEMDAIQNKLSAQLKGNRKDPLQQGQNYNEAIGSLIIMAMKAGTTAEQIEKLQDKINSLNASAEGTAAAFSPIADILNNLATNTLVEFGTQIGNLISGGEFSLDGFLGMIASALIQIGTHLVMVSKLFLAVKALFASNGLLAPFAIPIGIAAIAAGVALNNSLSKKQNVKAFANGGIVSGPTMGLIGEYPGAKSNPEVVAPLDKLKDMIGGQGGGSFILKGQDLVLAMNRSESSLKLRRG